MYDYIIIGGGPAGSTVAYCLQKSGARCVIIEKKLELNEKTCGGLLTWSGIDLLKQIGLDVDALFEKGATRINQFEYIENGKKIIHRYHDGEYGLGIRRTLLDQWLLEQARIKGADVIFGMDFKNIINCDNQFSVGKYSASNLIIATGANGFVPPTMLSEIHNQTFGLSAQIKGKTSLQENSVFFFSLEKDEEDYFWIIPNGNHVWNIGIWFKKIPTDAITQFWKYKKEIVDKYFSDILFVRSLRGAFCGNIDFSSYLPSGCYGVGDFSGTNRSSTGEGLRYAIESSISLAHFLENTKDLNAY